MLDERQCEVNISLSSRLKKISSLPMTAFICQYMLDGVLFTEASAINRNKLDELIERTRE